MTTAQPRPRRLIRTFKASDFRPVAPVVPLDPGDPKHPTVAGVVPDVAVFGEPELTLVVKGSGFLDSSVVLLGGDPLVSTYVNPNEIRALIDPSAVTDPQSFPVVVRNSRTRSKEQITFTFTSPDEVPEGTTEEVLAWVNYNLTRAQMALDAETANDEPRDDLVTELQALIAAGS